MSNRLQASVGVWLALALPGATAAQMNTLSQSEIDAGWTLLFDGRTTQGWGVYPTGEAPTGWTVQDGLLTRTGPGGDIMYLPRQFGDFDLRIDWRVEPGGNSGILYRGLTVTDYIYKTAPEMQVLDDERHPDGADPFTSAGSVYALYPAPRGVVHPAGEWNNARIVARGPHVEHWLNGVKVAEYELGSPDWSMRVAGSKFVQWPGFGTSLRGYLALQDHDARVWYRNVKLRELR
jgi:hypothetical protein